MLDAQLFQVFLLDQVQLGNAIVEPFLLLLLLVEEFLVALVVLVHLLFVLALFQFQLFLVQMFQVFDLLLALGFYSGFFTQQDSCLLVGFCLLKFDLNVKFVDLALALR